MKLLSCRQLSLTFLAVFLVAGCASAPKPVEPVGPSAEVTQAIAAAKAAIDQASGVDALWRDTADIMKSAEEAAAGGNDEAALKLANQARSQAELGINQHYLEKAKVAHEKASNMRGLSTAQRNALAAAGDAIRNGDGRKAYDLLAPMSMK